MERSLDPSIVPFHKTLPIKDLDGGKDKLWKDQLRAAFMLLVLRDPPHRIAAFFNVSHTTIYRWRDKVLASDDPEAEGFRRLIDEDWGSLSK